MSSSCQRSRRQPDHSGPGHSCSLPSGLPGARCHVVQRGPEPSRHYGSVQDVQQHGPAAGGTGEELGDFPPLLLPLVAPLTISPTVFPPPPLGSRSEFRPSWTCSCSPCSSPDPKSTRTTSTSTFTSWRMPPVWLKHGKRYKNEAQVTKYSICVKCQR